MGHPFLIFSQRPSAEELLHSDFIRSAKKGTGQLRALVEKHKKLKERQKLDEIELPLAAPRSSLISSSEPNSPDEPFGEASKRSTKPDRLSARVGRDGWDFSMRVG
jgi:hypothetical protein